MRYRTTQLPDGIRVGGIMSFFTTCFDGNAIVKNRRESYPFWALIYTQKGNVTFKIGEELYRVGAGEIVFYPADIPHSIVAVDSDAWEA